MHHPHDQRGITTKPPHPKSVAQDDHTVAPADMISRAEGPTSFGRRTECFEEAVGHQRD